MRADDVIKVSLKVVLLLSLIDDQKMIDGEKNNSVLGDSTEAINSHQRRQSPLKVRNNSLPETTQDPQRFGNQFGNQFGYHLRMP